MFEEWFKAWRRLFFWWLPSEDGEQGRGADAPTADKHRSADTTASAEVASESSTGETTAAASTTVEDDLTEIKGIGPALAKRLRNIGVTSFDHLAAADPEDLAHRLQMRPVTPERVRSWIEAAELRRGQRG